MIVMPNIPMFGAFRKLSGDGFVMETARTGIEFAINNHRTGRDKTPFLALSVRQFLWGYPSILYSMDSSSGGKAVELEEWGEESMEWGFGLDDQEMVTKAAKEPELQQFGFFIGLNGTVVGERTVHTGRGNLSRKGEVLAVGGQLGKRGAWSEDSCNTIEGRDPGTLTTALSKTEDLLLYFPNMCR